MNYDKFGQAYCVDDDLCDVLYQNPEQDISQFKLEDNTQYNASVAKYFNEFKKLDQYAPLDISVDEFDRLCQSQWNMPEEALEFDIISWLLNKCETQAELQRVGEELLLYQDKDLITLLKFLKYFVDTMTEHNIVWGVGRGSSVASYVLYLIGVHSVNSMYYDLDISEFLR